MSVEEIFNTQPVVTFDREVDRRNFLRWAGLVGVGATFAAGSVASASAASAAERETPFAASKGDLGILNYALTLEYLESTFYNMGVDAGVLKGRDAALVAPIKNHEAMHVAALQNTIKQGGGTPVAKPKIHFPTGTFSTADKFLGTAVQFEELGVVAYHGQVTLIQSVAYLAAAASIAGVESRHAAILEMLTHGKPIPNPIEMHEPMSYVLPKVKPYLG